MSRLGESATRFAQQSAASLAQGRADDCMAYAGIALEHLVKAFLIRQHPLLIVASPRGELDLPGMRWALHHESATPTDSITISASEAIRRCCHLLPGLDDKLLRPVLRARNGVLHLGQSDGDASRVVAAVARAALIIAPEIELDPRVLWGHYYEAVMGRLDERRNEVAVRVADRRAKAREDWEITFKRLGVEGMNALHDRAKGHLYTDAEEPVECPACGSDAVATGNLDVEDVMHIAQTIGYTHTSYDPYLEIRSVRCLACGFWLDGVEELDAAGVDSSRHATGREIDPTNFQTAGSLTKVYAVGGKT